MPGRDEGPVHSAEDVRGAEIELRKPWQRYVFIGGLAASVLFALILVLLGLA